MKKNNIAFDLDGVFVDSLVPFKRIVECEYEDEIIPINSYNIKTKYNMPVSLIISTFDKVFENYLDIPIYDGAVELCEKLYGITKEPIRFVTARPAYNMVNTHSLIERFCKVPFMVGFSGDGVNAKLKYLKYINYFVEDRRRTAYGMAKAGKKVFLVDTIYNQPTCIEPPTIKRISGIKDLVPIVDQFVALAN